MVTREAERAGAPGCVAALVPKAYGGSGGRGRCCELSGLPVPRQEAGEFMVLHPARDDLLEHVLQVGEGIDAVHRAGLDERGEDRPRAGSGIRTGEQGVVAPDGHLPVILPMSGRRSLSTTAGTRSMGV